MEKQKGFLFFRVFSLVVIIFFINLGIFVFNNIDFNQGFTGNSVKEVTKSTLSEIFDMPKISQIFLIAQWTLLILAIFYSVVHDKLNLKDRNQIFNINSYKFKNKNKTDIDILYSALKDKKSLKLSTISRAFRINKEVATEWCKILESGDLGVIDYPGFGEPVLRLKEKEQKESKETGNEKEKNKTEKNKEKSEKNNNKNLKKQKNNIKNENKKSKTKKNKINKKLKKFKKIKNKIKKL